MYCVCTVVLHFLTFNLFSDLYKFMCMSWWHCGNSMEWTIFVMYLAGWCLEFCSQFAGTWSVCCSRLCVLGQSTLTGRGLSGTRRTRSRNLRLHSVLQYKQLQVAALLPVTKCHRHYTILNSPLTSLAIVVRSGFVSVSCTRFDHDNWIQSLGFML